MKSATRSDTPPYFTAATLSGDPPVGGGIKRLFDIVLVLLALVVFCPIFLLLMALVKASDGGQIFYGHKRVGHNGRTFHCLKFRTMVQNGDQVLAQYLRTRPEALEEWQATRKLLNDPRVTVVGSVMRKLSLDELPQLFNILRGDMSIVGPRPVVEEELEMYGSAADLYLRSRPGLTGLWQISGRNDVSYATRVAFDTQYVTGWSFIQDVVIIAKTVPAVCLSRGSY